MGVGYMYMFVCVCVFKGMHAYMYPWRPEVDIGCLLLSSTSYLSQGLSLNLQLVNLAMLFGQ